MEDGNVIVEVIDKQDVANDPLVILLTNEFIPVKILFEVKMVDIAALLKAIVSYGTSVVFINAVCCVIAVVLSAIVSYGISALFIEVVCCAEAAVMAIFLNVIVSISKGI